jgi:chromosome segregation ATPase
MSLNQHFSDQLQEMLQDLEELGQEQRKAKRKAEDLDEEALSDRQVQQQYNARSKHVATMVSVADSKQSRIQELLETYAAMKDDESVYQDYLLDDPDAKTYVEAMEDLIVDYQEMLDAMLIGWYIDHKTGQQLVDLVEYQQGLYDGDHVMENFKDYVEMVKEVAEQQFEERIQRVEQKVEQLDDFLAKKRELDARIDDLEAENAELQQRVEEAQRPLHELSAEEAARRKDWTDDQAQALAFLRANAMTQEEIADVLGVQPSMISDWKKRFIDAGALQE